MMLYEFNVASSTTTTNTKIKQLRKVLMNTNIGGDLDGMLGELLMSFLSF
jgi:hypothetical protein